MTNKGLHQYRFQDNPLEQHYAEAWEKENTRESNGHGILDYLLAKDPNYPKGEVTTRDREVAATVVQWLGSSVGNNFVRDVLESSGLTAQVPVYISALKRTITAIEDIQRLPDNKAAKTKLRLMKEELQAYFPEEK